MSPRAPQHSKSSISGWLVLGRTLNGFLRLPCECLNRPRFGTSHGTGRYPGAHLRTIPEQLDRYLNNRSKVRGNRMRMCTRVTCPVVPINTSRKALVLTRHAWARVSRPQTPYRSSAKHDIDGVWDDITPKPRAPTGTRTHIRYRP